MLFKMKKMNLKNCVKQLNTQKVASNFSLIKFNSNYSICQKNKISFKLKQFFFKYVIGFIVKIFVQAIMIIPIKWIF